MSFKEYLKQNLNADRDKEPLTDKIFMRSVGVSFLAIIICIVVFTASTYAWFTGSIETPKTTIESSVYTLSISAEPVVTTSVLNGNSVYSLNKDTEYKISITALSEDTTGKTGYVKLIINGNSYISQQIDRGHKLEFTLSFTSDTEVEIVECWGTSSVPADARDINNGDSFVDMSAVAND